MHHFICFVSEFYYARVSVGGESTYGLLQIPFLEYINRLRKSIGFYHYRLAKTMFKGSNEPANHVRLTFALRRSFMRSFITRSSNSCTLLSFHVLHDDNLKNQVNHTLDQELSKLGEVDVC